MVDERAVVMVLAVTVVTAGTLAAITRPGLWRLGQEGTPAASSGVRYGGSYRSGRWVTATPRRQDWSGFQGRGPGAAK
ncbi:MULTISPECIES: hypothetical protein [unclassified Synechococcus]|jgi:FlaG/FlaF family flagellin (archaellin)|uniref:hypothetical protein n=1 Tax=unclassified Synechococcus TaxID=2626047 RepID=UPI000B97E644|nr:MULTISPECIES: hypothetical protein [unclassified Synechococcus]MBD2717688.1 hypothetical protein [Synechococcus sp. FACHB-909]